MKLPSLAVSTTLHPERGERPSTSSHGSHGVLLGVLSRSLALLGMRWAVLFTLAIPARLLAQVGHRPESSPYHDIRKGHTLTAVAGFFQGDGGKLNIGPHSGTVFGGRYDIRTGSTIQLGLAIMHGTLERFIVDPTQGPATRRSGPVDQSVTFAEVDIQFNVTGGKSWNHIAPYVTAGGGLAFAGDTPADPSEFDFGRKFYFTPGVGMRVFLGDRLHLRGEARVAFWKLEYPVTFQQEPSQEPGAPAVIPGNELTEWVSSPWFQVGVGYSFSP